MSKGYPNTSNPQAEKGTAVHELGEFCIKMGMSPKHCVGLKFNNLEVDDSMIDGATLYKSVVDSLSLRYGVKPLLEERVVMSSLGRNDVYGTSDVTHIALQQRTLHTSDYKNGYGVVDVNDNSQTAGYSVATLDTLNLWDKVDTIKNTIIQPNYQHVNGPIREVTYSISEMIEWRERFKIAVLRADDPNEKPVAGEWCHYCPAQANCRARMERVLTKAYTDTPVENISIGELEIFYKERGSIKRFLEMVEGRMLSEARNAVHFKDFKLVKSYSRASVEDEKGLLAEARKLGVNELDLYNDPKLVGKTKAAKLLPKDIIAKYYRVPPASTTLVENTDKRPALRPGKATGVFAPVNESRPSASGVFGKL
jgi:hypothetical protein